jgi:Putative transposase
MARLPAAGQGASKLFRRLFLTQLLDLHADGELAFFGEAQRLFDKRAFLRYLAPLRRKQWVVYAKPPFAGPEAVLTYLARYTHRVAIYNRRLISMGKAGITFRYKDYRRDGAARYGTMTLARISHSGNVGLLKGTALASVHDAGRDGPI